MGCGKGFDESFPSGANGSTLIRNGQNNKPGTVKLLMGVASKGLVKTQLKFGQEFQAHDPFSGQSLNNWRAGGPFSCGHTNAPPAPRPRDQIIKSQKRKCVGQSYHLVGLAYDLATY